MLPWLFAPAGFSQQLHEPALHVLFVLQLAARLADPHEGLIRHRPDRHHQPSAVRKLFAERFGHLRVPAVTMMASKGARSGQPTDPSAQR